MDLPFPYSLKHIALVKIAISVFNNPEIKALINEERTDGMLIFASFTHQQEMLRNITRILSNIPLPEIFKDKIAWFIIPITHEFDNWSAEHRFLTEGSDLDLQRDLRWRSSGMINWMKTAKNLVESQKLDAVKRFLLSCLYCLKDHVFVIWNEMSAKQRKSILQDYDFSVKKHWMKWLKHGTEPNWSRILNKCIASSHEFFNETPLSLSCFAPKLTADEREAYLKYHIRNNVVCKDDLLEYVHQMEPNERLNMFRNYAYHIVFFHLEWPFQEQFMYIVNSMWDYLREEQFLYIFLYLTAQHQRMCMDFDYSKLAQEFWQESPERFKDFVRNALRP